MTRLIADGYPAPRPYLHPALGNYYQCDECRAVFEVTELGKISSGARHVTDEYWGYARCPTCNQWVDLTAQPTPQQRSPWVLDWLTFGILLALVTIEALGL